MKKCCSDHVFKLQKDQGIKILREIYDGYNDDYLVTRLIGGAIIDILEDKKPKDYDLYDYPPTSFFIKKGFEFKYDTRYSTTFEKDGYIYQLLKTDINNFDFKISQASFWFNSGLLEIDDISFKNKKLIPVSYKKEDILNSLYRIPHWKRKGYDIDYITYKSMISVLLKEQESES